MLYVVECAYTDPQSEAAWNTFYNREKLPALVWMYLGRSLSAHLIR